MSEQFKDELAWLVIALAGIAVASVVAIISPIFVMAFGAAIALGWALDRLC